MNRKSYSFLSVAAALLALSVFATSAETNLKQIMQGLRDDVVVITDGLLNEWPSYSCLTETLIKSLI